MLVSIVYTQKEDKTYGYVLLHTQMGEEECGKGFLTRCIRSAVTVGPIVSTCAGRRVVLHLRCGLIYALHCTFSALDLEGWATMFPKIFEGRGRPARSGWRNDVRWRGRHLAVWRPALKVRGRKHRQNLGASCSSGNVNMSKTITWLSPNESKRYYGRDVWWATTKKKGREKKNGRHIWWTATKKKNAALYATLTRCMLNS